MSLSGFFAGKRTKRRFEYWRRRIFGPHVASWSDLESFARIAGSVPACWDRLLELGYQYVADGPDDSYKHPLCFLGDLKGDCEDVAIFLAECAAVLGVDARIVVVEYALDGPLSPLPLAHAICVFNDGGRWRHASNWGVSPYSRLTIESLLKAWVFDDDVVVPSGESGTGPGFVFPHFKRGIVLRPDLSVESEILA